MPLVADPVYTTITKGPRAGAKIINWAATAEQYEERLKLANELYTARGQTIDRLFTERGTFVATANLAMTHWSSMLWPKRIWAAFKQCGMSM